MVGLTDPRSARRRRRARFAFLALGGLLLGHTAVYATAYGDGAGFAAAMRLGGHDGYWPAFAGAALAALVVLAADGLLGLLRAWRRMRHGAARSGPSDRGGSDRGGSGPATGALAADYLNELLDIWGPLFLVVSLAFLVQENVEGFVVHGQAPLLGVFTVHLVAAPVLALVTGLLAALGALVRWQTAVLVARARRLAPPWARPLPSRPHRRWSVASAARAARRALLRQDPGRAPPAVVLVPA